MKKFLVFIVLSFLGVLILGGVSVFYFLNVPASNNNEKVIFEISQGSGFHQVNKKLYKKKLITNKFFFYLMAKFENKLNSIRMGEYELDRKMPPQKILSIIASGKSRTYPITFQEGLNIFEIAEHLEKKRLGKKEKFLELARNPQLIKKLLGFSSESLEGYLFPETYRLTKYTTEKDLILLMHERFKNVFSSLTPLIDDSPLSPRELVVLASIVEKETGVATDRPIIASVFYNRLEKNMRLQTDPTTIYGLWLKTGQRPFNLTKKDLRTKNSYNTYTFKGLPRGPISNPGKDSFLAVLKPKHTPFFYFVSRNDGTTAFSKNYEDHQKAVRNYQLNRKARQGKSWRDVHQIKN